MKHLVLGLHFLALTAGAASLGQAVLIWLRQRKPVIRLYALFLLATWLILLALAVGLYAGNASLAGDPGVAAMTWGLQAAGGLLFIAASPFFYFALLGLAMQRAATAAFLAVDALAVACTIAFLAAPGLAFLAIALQSLLFGMIALGLVLIAANLRRTADLVLRRALLVFLLLSLAFFPLMWADAALGWLLPLAPLAFIEGLPLALYFLSLNCLSIAFGLRYLNRPAYADGGHLTPYFLETFGITEREADVVRMLLEGASGRDVADKLYISAKTVENHVSSIYRKTGARNRVQLFRLIRANTLEPSS